MVTVRAITSIDELARVHQVISAQFPPRRSAAAHGLEDLTARFDHDRTLMLLAKSAGEIVGGFGQWLGATVMFPVMPRPLR